MKIRNSLKSLLGRHRDNQLVRRKGRVYIINKTQKRFKAARAEAEARLRPGSKSVLRSRVREGAAFLRWPSVRPGGLGRVFCAEVSNSGVLRGTTAR